MKRVISYAVALVALAAFATGHGIVDSLENLRFHTSYVAEDSAVGNGTLAMIIQYVGTEENGQVDGNASGDILLLDGDLGAEAADTNASGDCGAVDGTLDVSDADCDTFGELVDEINSFSNWIAVLVDVLPSDDSGASGLIILDPGSAQDAKVPEGYALYVDTTASDDVSLSVLPFGSKYARSDIRNWTSSDAPEGNQLKDQGAMWKGLSSAVLQVSDIFSDGDGDTTNLYIYAVDQDGIVANGYSGVSQTQIYLKDQGTDDAYYNEDFTRVPLFGEVGDRLYVYLRATALDTGPTTLAVQSVTGRLK